MSLLVWIVVGLIAGFLARLAVPGKEPGPGGIIGDLLVGIIGALVGGWIFRAFGGIGITGINLGSIIVAFVGGVVFLLVWRALSGTRTGHRHI